MKRLGIILALFLGLLFSAKAAIGQDQVIVSTRTIYPGQLISASDLTIVPLTRPVGVQYPVVRRMEEIVGLTAARTILAGRFIPTNAGRAATIIKAGTPTKVMVKVGTLSISTTAVPLSDASVGETVRLRNPSSGKTYSGIVLDDGSVLAGAV